MPSAMTRSAGDLCGRLRARGAGGHQGAQSGDTLQDARRRRGALERPPAGQPLSFALKGLRSWRTGDWRIIYEAETEKGVVVVTVGHRRDVYERVRRLLS